MTKPAPSERAYRAAARRRYEIDGEIEIEAYAVVEDAEHRPGCWVEAWLYVSDDEARAEVERGAAEAAGALRTARLAPSPRGREPGPC